MNTERSQRFIMDLKPLASRSWRALAADYCPDRAPLAREKICRSGRENERGKFFLLQGLRQRQRVILMQHGRNLEHDGALRNQRSHPGHPEILPVLRLLVTVATGLDAGAGGAEASHRLGLRLQMIRGRLRIGGMIEIPIGIFLRGLRGRSRDPVLAFGFRGGRSADASESRTAGRRRRAAWNRTGFFPADSRA